MGIRIGDRSTTRTPWAGTGGRAEMGNAAVAGIRFAGPPWKGFGDIRTAQIFSIVSRDRFFVFMSTFW